MRGREPQSPPGNMGGRNSSLCEQRKAKRQCYQAQQEGRASAKLPPLFSILSFAGRTESQKSIYILQTQCTFYASLPLPSSFPACPSLLHSSPSLVLQDPAPRCLLEPFPDSRRQVLTLAPTGTLQDNPLLNLSLSLSVTSRIAEALFLAPKSYLAEWKVLNRYLLSE